MNKALNIILIFFILISNEAAFASYLANGFLITEKSIDFDKIIPAGKCYGTIPYPELSNGDEELSVKVNDEIRDFVRLYAICNKGDRNNFSVTYDMPKSGSDKFFSIRWITKKDGKLWRIDTLNFSIQNADLLDPDDIFMSNSSNFMKQLVNLSEGHLNKGDNWEQFLAKIANNDIQLYINKKEWHIVFNSTPKQDKVVDIKLPEYFLQGRDDTSEE